VTASLANQDTATATAARRALPTPLGWRINQWAVLTGTSRPTIWRQVKDGRLKLIDVNGIKLVPRSEAVRLGLIAA
jgi:transcriptional regulator of acetoin/glycerol metabolism